MVEETGEFENPVIIDYSLDGEINRKETKIDKMIEGTLESSLVNEIKEEMKPVFLEETIDAINDIKPSYRQYEGSVTKIGTEPYHQKVPAFNVDGKWIKTSTWGLVIKAIWLMIGELTNNFRFMMHRTLGCQLLLIFKIINHLSHFQWTLCLTQAMIIILLMLFQTVFSS
ncbi:MAG: hypothetical protein L6V95_11545 [Candidatus Melainabacteria bacterium]|nr:MAG: hypothetical protein L6V95_11545 [Candidatus Melainabacteria bacterium]